MMFSPPEAVAPRLTQAAAAATQLITSSLWTGIVSVSLSGAEMLENRVAKNREEVF